MKSFLAFILENDEQTTENVYKIQKGDTLTGIAKQNNMTVDDLLALNPDIKDKNMIKIDQSIRLKANQPQQNTTPTQQTTPEPVAAAPKRTKTVSATEFATMNAQRNGMLGASDLVNVGTLTNPTPWNSAYGDKPWYFGKAYLHPQAADSFKAMDDAFFKETGSRIRISSAYRGREQQAMFGGKYSVAAKPGTSRHGLGLALDIQPGTPEFDWVKQHGNAYGWGWANIKNDACHFGYCGNINVEDKD